MLKQKNIDKALKALEEAGLDKAVIKADAAAILSSATNTVKAILEKRDALDKQGRKNEPLVILIGEDHTLPSNALHHLAMITQLQNAEAKPALTIEQEHNALLETLAKERAFRKLSKEKLSALFKEKMPPYNNDLLYEFAKGKPQDHPYSIQSTLRFFKAVMKNNIPVKFTDVAVNAETALLNTNDPSTRSSVMETIGSDETSVSTISRRGIWARNHHMKKMTDDFAAQTKARIIIQICGAEHVAGSDDTPYQRSMVQMFKDANQPVAVGYTIQNDTLKAHAANDAELKTEELLPSFELPKHKSYYSVERYTPYAQGPSRRKTSLLDKPENEAAYADAVLKEMGLGEYTLNKRDYLDMRKKANKELKQRVQNWRQDIKNRPGFA